MMKKINVFVFCLLMSLAAAAQEAKFGLKAGGNLSTLNYSNGTDVDVKPGFNAGGLAHVHITPAFSLQPEIYFSTQGAKFPTSGTDKINFNLNYINVPVLLQYNFSNGFRLQGGPQVGFLLSAKEKLNGQQIADMKSNLKTVDFSLPLGLSYLFYSGFGIDGRYNLGLSNINNNGTAKIKNNVGQLGIFYLFDHKHKVESAPKTKLKVKAKSK